MGLMTRHESHAAQAHTPVTQDCRSTISLHMSISMLQLGGRAHIYSPCQAYPLYPADVPHRGKEQQLCGGLAFCLRVKTKKMDLCVLLRANDAHSLLSPVHERAQGRGVVCGIPEEGEGTRR